MWRPCATRRPRGVTTARRNDCVAVGWAWTGRNLILDEALFTLNSRVCLYSVFDVFFIRGITWCQCDMWSSRLFPLYCAPGQLFSSVQQHTYIYIYIHRVYTALSPYFGMKTSFWSHWLTTTATVIQNDLICVKKAYWPSLNFLTVMPGD